MLNRLQTDCDYYLGCGGRSKKNLHQLDETEQIREMLKIYNQLDEKPKWLTLEQIKEYAEKMGVNYESL
jgi:hypothetical protein